ncbi:hypothetical protein GOBAR_DD00522 [Gossypium barbadense]|nr:hypothetical protein GOBAR_DD00522 [Gossypium barbadense]
MATSATKDMIEASKNLSSFVEIGYISSVHGLQGEICIKPNTDFLELRFCKQQVLSKETIKEVELVEGREHPGKKSWILSFSGIETVDQARQLVGSTLLAEEEDRPHLEKGEFYTRDLVGMRAILKILKHKVSLLEASHGELRQELQECRLTSEQLARRALDAHVFFPLLFSSLVEYCEKYVKPEDIVGAEEVKSSDEKLSEDEYAASEDEETAGKTDL